MSAVAISAGSFVCFAGLYGCLKRALCMSTVSANACVSGLHALVMIVLSFRVLASISDYWNLIGDVTPPHIVNRLAQRRREKERVGSSAGGDAWVLCV